MQVAVGDLDIAFRPAHLVCDQGGHDLLRDPLAVDGHARALDHQLKERVVGLPVDAVQCGHMVQPVGVDDGAAAGRGRARHDGVGLVADPVEQVAQMDVVAGDHGRGAKQRVGPGRDRQQDRRERAGGDQQQAEVHDGPPYHVFNWLTVCSISSVVWITLLFIS